MSNHSLCSSHIPRQWLGLSWLYGGLSLVSSFGGSYVVENYFVGYFQVVVWCTRGPMPLLEVGISSLVFIHWHCLFGLMSKQEWKKSEKINKHWVHFASIYSHSFIPYTYTLHESLGKHLSVDHEIIHCLLELFEIHTPRVIDLRLFQPYCHAHSTIVRHGATLWWIGFWLH